MENKTWELVDVPKDKDVTNIKWVYKKYVDGNVQKHKERMVARGFTQQPDIDINDTFSHVALMVRVITIMAIVAQNKCQVYQMDVKLTFLNGYLA